MMLRRLTCVVVAVSMTACATRASGLMSAEQFSVARYDMDASKLCGLWSDASQRGDSNMVQLTENEILRRNGRTSDCARFASSQKEEAVSSSGPGVLAVMLAIGAAIALGKRGGGRGFVGASGTVDLEWDWDLIYAPGMVRATWVCRGVQTGQFMDLWRCNGKPQADWRWPGLGDPFAR